MPRLPPRVAIGLWAVAALESSLMLASPLFVDELLIGGWTEENLGIIGFLATLGTVVMTFATSGILIIRRQPRNAVGWVMLAGGPALGLVFVGYLGGVALADSDPTIARWFVLAGALMFGPVFFLLAAGLASVFPDGRPLAGWWTWGLFFTMAAVGLGSLLVAVTPGPLDEEIPLTNPIGIGAISEGMRDVADAVIGLALAAGALLAVASLAVRYVRASPDTRHQLKWFISACVVVALMLPMSLIVGENWTAILALLALALIPVAVVVAVLRHRLYEIDTLINRTLVYIPLVGIVAGLYAGMVALLQRLFTAVTGNTSDAAAVISALALAAVFTPIRNAIQSAVDRRFKPDGAASASQWDDPEFRAAVEAIVRDVTRPYAR
jgi:hypothetical protein